MPSNNSEIQYVHEPLITWYKLKWALLYWLIITGSLWTGFQVAEIYHEIVSGEVSSGKLR